tara:strand:+ start:162 stop:698 length:537 start_codon:yes stop_codon:yes gene_type:complete
MPIQRARPKLTDLRGGTPLTTMPAGTVLQVVNGVTPTTATPAQTSEVSINNATPQPTGFYVLITPSSTSSKIFIGGRVSAGVNYSSGEVYWDIYRGIDGATPAYVATSSVQTNVSTDYSNDWSLKSMPVQMFDSPNTTSQVRYEVYARSHSSSYYVYINKSASLTYGVTNLIAMEIKG